MSSSAMDDEESSPVNNMPHLPDEIVLNCLARVSRLYYPTLSLVSKRFRSILSSTELYETRKLLNRTENCLYLCSKKRWFTLSRGPTQIENSWTWFTSRKSKSIGNLLVSFPAPRNFFSNHYFFTRWIPTTIGSKIYMIGGYINHKPSSKVFVMDCVSHTWHEAPSMLVARMYPHVSVLDGKIYVVEAFSDDCDSLVECFDLKTQRWEQVPNPGLEIRVRFVHKTVALDGKLYLLGGDKNVVYKSKENKWEEVTGFNMLLYGSPSPCVVDNVLYCYRDVSSRRLEWYDSETGFWRAVKGLEVEELPKLPKGYRSISLVNYGGRIVVYWVQKVRCGAIGFTKKKMIWRAEIAVERRSQHEVYGKVQSCDVVLRVPKSCRFKQFIVTTL